MKKSTKIARTTSPTIGPFTAKGVRNLRRILPHCRALGAAIGGHTAIQALGSYGGRPAGTGDPNEPWGRALSVAQAARADATLLERLDVAHGHALAGTSDEAFLTGFYAGLAAVKGGAR